MVEELLIEVATCVAHSDEHGTTPVMPGDLHYGDNLEVLRRKIATGSVDLVYLDPPFNSDRTYNTFKRAPRLKPRRSWTHGTGTIRRSKPSSR